ncbi:2-dehydro-3-deoxygalactonokinase [Rhizobium halophytocola]|uniref:2-dehydro-3-deoxygalactonokinase n=1 Tax=Rhizobium halophytocola TaxID=735519 RepID=A0ABS4E504_9HYPH|nr:2-dehydro-3-deoxygalactonokinase [Rhizobium halophytocola]
MTQPCYALVDWGTTNLRLWLVDADGAVLAERQSAEGMGNLSTDQFAGVLETHLAALGAPADLPVMMAGMVGARTGWVEVPYAVAPADLTTLADSAFDVPQTARPVAILPGVCQTTPLPHDVMRGEETQLAGAVADGLVSAVFCLPGTHSKWAIVEDGRLSRFATVMTGELFSLLSRQSILRLTIDADATTEPGMPEFAEGVRQGLRPGFALSAELFSFRAAALLAGLTPTSAAARLSGMLIGAEIAAMASQIDNNATIYIVGSDRLTALYRAGLSHAGLACEALDGASLVRKGLFAAARLKYGRKN